MFELILCACVYSILDVFILTYMAAWKMLMYIPTPSDSLR